MKSVVRGDYCRKPDDHDIMLSHTHRKLRDAMSSFTRRFNVLFSGITSRLALINCHTALQSRTNEILYQNHCFPRRTRHWLYREQILLISSSISQPSWLIVLTIWCRTIAFVKVHEPRNYLFTYLLIYLLTYGTHNNDSRSTTVFTCYYSDQRTLPGIGYTCITPITYSSPILWQQDHRLYIVDSQSPTLRDHPHALVGGRRSNVSVNNYASGWTSSYSEAGEKMSTRRRRWPSN